MSSEGELKNLLWKKLGNHMIDFGNHMIDSGEYSNEEVDKLFSEIVDEAKKELFDQLGRISRNAELMETSTDSEKTLKTLILTEVILKVYETWFKHWLGENK